MDEVKPVAYLPTVEHREPCKSRGSRTVLGAPGGEIPPGNSTFTSVWTCARQVRYAPDRYRIAAVNWRGVPTPIGAVTS